MKQKQYEHEILETERAFAALAQEKGMRYAFLHYADDEAVLLRDNTLVKGKIAIAEYFDSQNLQDVQLDWTPELVNVAESGDLGYTYGKYTFEGSNESGNPIHAEGIFHTVWKRRADGEWRYVWD